MTEVDPGQGWVPNAVSEQIVGARVSDLSDCVLVVDDESIISSLWCAIVEGMGLEVCGTATTAWQAVALAQTYRPSVILMDVRLRGERDGVDAALEIHDTVGSKVIFITGSGEPSMQARINMDHPAAILFKPITDSQLQDAINDAMRH
jgi:CheY-like chemotaxis protein